MARKKVPAVAPVTPYQLKGTVQGKNIVFERATFDGFVNFMAKLGLQADNQLSGGHYSFGPFLSRNRQELEAAYRGSWIVGKVVDAVAEDMTKKGAEIVSQMDPKEIAQIDRAMKRLRVWRSLCSAIKWSRLFGGGLAVMLIDQQKLDTPLRVETIRKGQFKGFLVLDRWLVQPSLEDLITEFGIDLGMPKYYSVIGDAAALPNVRIHHSRVVRFDGIELNYYGKKMENGWGISEVERMHDRLMAFDSATIGMAQLVFKAHLRGVKVKSLREALTAGGAQEEAVIKMFDYIRRFQTNEGLTLLDGDDEFWAQSYTFSGLSDVLMQLGQQVSGAAHIPLVRMFGMAPAGLNATGESDLRNYYDEINSRQETDLAPALAEKIYPVISMSVLGKPLPEDFDFAFRSLWQMQDKEKVEMAKTVSDSVNESVNSGVIGRKTALKELRQSSKTTGIFSNITDETIEAASDDVEPKGEVGLEIPGFEGQTQDNVDEQTVDVRLKDPDGSLMKLLKHLAATANPGHSFTVIVDPDRDPQRFGFDGDGAFQVMSINGGQPWND
jgi:phage-related protein (TIGR01555 family)